MKIMASMEFNGRTILWLISFTFIWPLAHLALFLIRFSKLPANMISESAVFIPMGFLSGLFLLYMLQKSTDSKQKKGAVSGYVAAFPVAFIGSLLGGLLITPWIGTLIFGFLPLLFGIYLGYKVGQKL